MVKRYIRADIKSPRHCTQLSVVGLHLKGTTLTCTMNVKTAVLSYICEITRGENIFKKKANNNEINYMSYHQLRD